MRRPALAEATGRRGIRIRGASLRIAVPVEDCALVACKLTCRMTSRLCSMRFAGAFIQGTLTTAFRELHGVPVGCAPRSRARPRRRFLTRPIPRRNSIPSRGEKRREASAHPKERKSRSHISTSAIVCASTTPATSTILSRDMVRGCSVMAYVGRRRTSSGPRSRT